MNNLVNVKLLFKSYNILAKNGFKKLICYVAWRWDLRFKIKWTRFYWIKLIINRFRTQIYNLNLRKGI